MSLTQPPKKAEKTVTYVDGAGNKLEVVTDASKAALRILKKQGFRKESDVHKEQDEASFDKDDQLEEAKEAKKAPAKKAPPRSQG